MTAATPTVATPEARPDIAADDRSAPAWLTRRQPHPDTPRLDALVGDPDEFRREVLFRRPLWSPGEGAARPGFVTSAELWDGALRRGLRTPAFRLVRDGNDAVGG